MKKILFLCCLIYSLMGDSIALTAIFRNEARFLKEWIEYYRLIGVENFYLTNHLSEDEYLEVLQPYIDKGIVTLRQELKEVQSLNPDWRDTVVRAYNWGLLQAAKTSKWCLVVDTDEFLVPKKEKLKDILKDFEPYAGVAVNWQIFGTSNISKIPEGKLLIETLVRRGPYALPDNCHTKLIVQPKRVETFLHPHCCRAKPYYWIVDMEHHPMTGQTTALPYTSRLQLNHYWSRDEEFFWQVKQARKPIWGDWFENMEQKLLQLNQERDGTILKYVPTLRKRMGLPN